MSSIPTTKDVFKGALLNIAIFLGLYLVIPNVFKEKMGIVALIFIIGGFLMVAKDKAGGKKH